jgi:hypothetical protein
MRMSCTDVELRRVQMRGEDAQAGDQEEQVLQQGLGERRARALVTRAILPAMTDFADRIVRVTELV